MDYRKEIQELRRTLTENGYLYYVLDAPTMSDYEYDHLLRRLEELEAEHPEEITPDSPTQRIGGQTLTEFQQVTHAVPLESLQDVFNDDEVCRFLEKIPLEKAVQRRVSDVNRRGRCHARHDVNLPVGIRRICQSLPPPNLNSNHAGILKKSSHARA